MPRPLPMHLQDENAKSRRHMAYNVDSDVAAHDEPPSLDFRRLQIHLFDYMMT